MNYDKRIENIRKIMIKNDLSAILLPPDSSWEYAAGVPRMWNGNTRQRQNSLDFACLLITSKEVIVFCPRLSALGITPRIKDSKIINQIVLYQDNDLIGKTFKDKLKSLDLVGAKVGVNRDITATCVLMMADALNIQSKDISKEMDILRSIKDADEIALMRKASEITDQIFYDIKPMVRPGILIRDIERQLDILIEKYGCQKSSFPSEVLNHGTLAGDSIGASYHTVTKNHTIAFDFGVVYSGYCSDFGRTLFIGEPSRELIQIHDLVMLSQQSGMEALKAGKVSGAQVNQAARKPIEDAGYGSNFIHRLGHGIGKDVHERPFLAEGEDIILQPGMLFTVEPSIYKSQDSLVRVEDVVLVTETGFECLNKASKNIHIVE
jgi:Xaa-Pro aminopeptidase